MFFNIPNEYLIEHTSGEGVCLKGCQCDRGEWGEGLSCSECVSNLNKYRDDSTDAVRSKSEI